MILVTGAGGKTGRAVVRALAEREARVRALVHRPEHGPQLRGLGASEVVAGDMLDRDAMARAMEDVRAVYHIAPNMCPDEVHMGEIALWAARRAGATHFVYHSVLHPQTEKMPHHWLKLQVEERILESGLDFTILQPAAYMQNLRGYWRAIVEEGVYRVPYAASTRLGMVDLNDVAEAAATVLTETGHEGAIYELCGPDILTQEQVAVILTRVLKRPVRVVPLSPAEWETGARRVGLSAYAIDTLKRMFRYYEEYGLWGNPNVLRWLLGHPPTRFEVFVARMVESREEQDA